MEELAALERVKGGRENGEGGVARDGEWSESGGSQCSFFFPRRLLDFHDFSLYRDFSFEFNRPYIAFPFLPCAFLFFFFPYIANIF